MSAQENATVQVETRWFEQPVPAIGGIAIGMALIPLNDAFIKIMGDRLPVHQIMAMRAIPALFLALLIPGAIAAVRGLSPKTIGLLLLRGSILVVAMVLYFMGVVVLPLGEATALFFTAPLLISLLSVPILGETLGPWRLFAVLLGLLGVLFIAQPQALVGLFKQDIEARSWGWAVILPLASATFYAAFQLFTRYIRASAEASAMAVGQQMVYVLVGVLGGLLVFWLKPGATDDPSLRFLLSGWTSFTATDLLFCILGAFITLFLSLASANAYRSAEAAFVAPFEYAALPFAVLWGGVIWGEWPNHLSTIGIALILGAGLLVLFRERVKKVELASKAPMPSASATSQEEGL